MNIQNVINMVHPLPINARQYSTKQYHNKLPQVNSR